MTSRSRGLLWQGLRLLVIDVETTYLRDDKAYRIVSIAAVTCVAGKVGKAWSQPLINPEVSIDAGSTRVHDITDGKVMDAPTFAAVAAELLPHLAVDPGERLVLVAHHVNFDIPIVRAEMERAGLALPDLPVLDTMGGLAALAGVAPGGKALADLLAALSLTNEKEHSALGDARATAAAACALLGLAADQGHDELDDLLAALGGRTSASLRASGPIISRGRVEEAVLPDDHIAGHATLLAKMGKRVTAKWLAAVVECASMRCPHLVERVNLACPLHADAMAGLLDQLETVAKSGNVPATATLLGALMLHFHDLPPSPTGRRDQALRLAAATLDARLGPTLDALERCQPPEVCPSCFAGDACPLDAWRLDLAPVVLSLDPDRFAGAFFSTEGKDAGKQVWDRLRRTGHHRLADATLRLCHHHWVTNDNEDEAGALAALAMEVGCRDPEIAEARALGLARRGRGDDFTAAIRLCDAVLDERKGSTEAAWNSLAVARSAIAGRYARLTGSAERRHFPKNPRVRPPRFTRPIVIGGE